VRILLRHSTPTYNYGYRDERLYDGANWHLYSPGGAELAVLQPGCSAGHAADFAGLRLREGDVPSPAEERARGQSA
jgi:hypothetical protein